MSIEQNLYEEKFEKIFPLKPVLNAIACINRTFAVNPIWYILSGLVLRLARGRQTGLDKQFEQSENDNPGKDQFKVARYDKSFTLFGRSM